MRPKNERAISLDLRYMTKERGEEETKKILLPAYVQHDIPTTDQSKKASLLLVQIMMSASDFVAMRYTLLSEYAKHA